MTQTIFNTTGTLSTVGITDVSGIIDVGSANGNLKVAFTIPDLSVFAGEGFDELIHVGINGAGSTCMIFAVDSSGLYVSTDNGSVVEDDHSWAGASTASVSVTTRITFNYTILSATQNTRNLSLMSGDCSNG